MPSWCHPLKEKSCLSSFLSMILDTVGLNIPAWVKSASVFVILFAKAMSYQLSLNLKEYIIPLTMFTKKVLLSKCIEVRFVDSYSFCICCNQWTYT